MTSASSRWFIVSCLLLGCGDTALKSRSQNHTLLAPLPPRVMLFADPSQSLVGDNLTISVRIVDMQGQPLPDEQRDITLVASGAAVLSAEDGTVDIMNGEALVSITDSTAQEVVVGILDTENTGFDTSASLVLNFFPGTPSRVQLKGPAMLSTSSCGAYEAFVLDQRDNPAPMLIDTAVVLGGQGPGSFFSDKSCTNSAQSTTVEASSSSAKFYFKSTQPTEVTLTGTINELASNELARGSLPVKVLPAASLVILEAPLFDFGLQPLGSTTQHTFTVKNEGILTAANIEPLPILAPFSFAGGAWPGQGGTCVSELASQQTCTFVVDFSPTVFGEKDHVLMLNYTEGFKARQSFVVITSNSCGTLVSFERNGQIVPNPEDFGVASSDVTRQYALRNRGDTVSCPFSIGVNGDKFDLSQNNCIDQALAGGGACLFSVTFKGSGETLTGTFTGTITASTLNATYMAQPLTAGVGFKWTESSLAFSQTAGAAIPPSGSCTTQGQTVAVERRSVAAGLQIQWQESGVCLNGKSFAFTGQVRNCNDAASSFAVTPFTYTLCLPSNTPSTLWTSADFASPVVDVCSAATHVLTVYRCQ